MKWLGTTRACPVDESVRQQRASGCPKPTPATQLQTGSQTQVHRRWTATRRANDARVRLPRKRLCTFAADLQHPPFSRLQTSSMHSESAVKLFTYDGFMIDYGSKTTQASVYSGFTRQGHCQLAHRRPAQLRVAVQASPELACGQRQQRQPGTATQHGAAHEPIF